MSETNGFATRSMLIGASDGGRRFGETTLPISGLKVRFRSLSDAEFTAYEHSFFKDADGEGTERDFSQTPLMEPRLIVACLCDGDGKPILTKDDEPAISSWDMEDVAYLSHVLRIHLRIPQRAERGRLEALAKNS